MKVVFVDVDGEFVYIDKLKDGSFRVCASALRNYGQINPSKKLMVISLLITVFCTRKPRPVYTDRGFPISYSILGLASPWD